MFLTDDREVGLVGQERKHNQVCVCTVKTMASIGIVFRFGSCLADIIQHFVLALSWYVTIRYNTLFQPLIEGVCADLVLNKEVKLGAQVDHKLGTWRNRIRIEHIRHIFTLRT